MKIEFRKERKSTKNNYLYKSYGIYLNNKYSIGFFNSLAPVKGIKRYIFMGRVHNNFMFRILFIGFGIKDYYEYI